MKCSSVDELGSRRNLSLFIASETLLPADLITLIASEIYTVTLFATRNNEERIRE